MPKSPLPVVLLSAAALLGPGRLAADEELATVSGVVTLDGKPLDGVRVVFHIGDGEFVGAKTDENGKYKLTRVPVGTHRITVEMAPGGKVKLPDKYAREETTPLRGVVKKEPGRFDLSLQSR